MGIIKLHDRIESFNSEQESNIYTEKFCNLLKIAKLNYCIPELIYFDEEEYKFFCKYKKLSKEAKCAINDFIFFIKNKGEIPLFAVRCEGKGEIKKNDRLPHSVLNIGINSYRDEKIHRYPSNLGESFLDIQSIYYDRAKRYEEYIDIDKKYISVFEEVNNWIEVFYSEMKKKEPNLNHGIILQQMVFGNINEISGMGICCNRIGKVDKDTRFKGIFLQQQQGISIKQGCWGKNERSLDALKEINPVAYKKIYEIFCVCEEKYGKNPYLEFEVVDDKVYILQYEERQRNVDLSYNII